MKFAKLTMMLAAAIMFTGAVYSDDDHAHVLDTSKENMKKMAQSLGVKCSHCHIDKTPEGKPDFEAASKLKDTAIQMKQHFVDSLRTTDGNSLDCQTCHNGHAKFITRDHETDTPPRLFANTERREIMTTMRAFTKALDVKCLFCHTKAADGRMDPTIPTKHRRMARYMIDNFGSLELLDGQPATCMTCHQGKTEFLPTHGE
jgi:hypothetical protein